MPLFARLVLGALAAASLAVAALATLAGLAPPTGAEVAGVYTPPAAAVPAPLAPVEQTAISPLESALLSLANADRASNGLPPLALDRALLEIARVRASAQLTQADLDHYDESGQLAFVGLLTLNGLDYALAGENLARSPDVGAATPSRVEQALMASPTHRKNILEPAFNRAAVGVATDDRGRVAFAQIFRAAP